MWTRYCKKFHLVIAESKDASHAWKKMIVVREEVELNMWWQLKEGEVNFWFDIWTKQGALYFLEENNVQEENKEVKQFIRNEKWDVPQL